MTLEGAAEVARAQTGGLGQTLQRERLREMCIDEAVQLLHPGRGICGVARLNTMFPGRPATMDQKRTQAVGHDLLGAGLSATGFRLHQADHGGQRGGVGNRQVDGSVQAVPEPVVLRQDEVEGVIQAGRQYRKHRRFGIKQQVVNLHAVGIGHDGVLFAMVGDAD